MSPHRLFIFFVLSLLLPVPQAFAQTVVVETGGIARLQNGGAFNVAGNLTVNGLFSPEGGTTVRLTREGTITSAKKVAFSNLTINLPAPTDFILLKASLSISGLLDVQQGDVDLNGSVIDLGTDGTLQEAAGQTVRGTAGYLEATRTLSPPPGTDVNIAGLGLAIASSANLGQTNIRRGHAPQDNAETGNEGIARYFDIQPTTNTGLNATLLFFYDESELRGMDETTFLLYRSEDGGTTWTEEGGTSNPSSNYVSLNGIDAFSRWTLAAPDAPLPVELTSFHALLGGDAALLEWTTATETNNAGFVVMHRAPCTSSHGCPEEMWREHGFVEGYGTTAEPHTYSYQVDALMPGTHRFRLKQIDFDGTFDFSPEVEVAVAVAGRYHLSPAYPNPFTLHTTFSLSVAQTQHVRIDAFDALGRRAATLFDASMPAHHSRAIVFDASSLPAGIYLIRVAAEHFVDTHRVVLVR